MNTLPSAADAMNAGFYAASLLLSRLNVNHGPRPFHYSTQEPSHWPPNVFLGEPTPEQYPMQPCFQPSNDQYAGEQPMNCGYDSNEAPESQDPRPPGHY
ncbi:hypothetical protein PAXRUDRAFT_8991 [Paxillus rubicundulus Ve08.2h10]|uniref:Unplaced genomic scaffold scaffold_43, whole genome shotgun sequence n=1 Tax=Paxillus rubicundulus Ve08.2h10 TaxID=930991 RepID=A0A0D0E4F4_9AGAM|nr:hypothetical protein PAXRUDRAFT_8991 [Paxillus rubicundulus Ve08.2h10]